MFFVGVDGGGTKTDILVLDEKGRSVASKRMGTISYKNIGAEQSIRILREGIESVLSAAATKDGEASVCIAYPTWGESPENEPELEKQIAKIAPHPIMIVNDCVAGWAGSLALEKGINLVAGTGSIAYGRDDAGNEARAGGWSEHFSDEGSCYWLGLKTLALFAKESDGRVKRSVLSDVFREHFQIKNDLDMIDVFDSRYKGNRTAIAGLQKLLLDAARRGDDEAKKLYGQAADELASIVTAVRGSLSGDGEMKVSYSGGLFYAEELILDPLRKRLEEKGLTLCPPRYSPVQGAALLAAAQTVEGRENLANIMSGLDGK